MFMSKDNRIELMAPAGDFASLQAAIDNGADSVYFGVEQLNMRARSTINFEIKDLYEIKKRCKEKNIRTYLTLNTIVYDHDLSIVKKLLLEVKKNGITAVIASDQAVISMAKELDIEVHISTQVNITNIEVVKFYSLFADTMVLSRELSLSQIKKIVDDIEKFQIKGPSGRLVEIEIFGHGALCMAVSGKCYISLHSYNSSANRGACKQNCRKGYIVKDKETGFEMEIDNEYIMSPKDLCTVEFLDKIIDSGVKVLKLEGRGRAPEYVANVVRNYIAAIESYYQGSFSKERAQEWKEDLRKVYNRDFWSGYYLGQKMGEWTESSGSLASQKKVYIGEGKHYFPKTGIAEFKIDAYDLSLGDTILITGPTTGVKEMVLDEMLVNDQNIGTAKKGDSITFKTDFRIRLSDKIYKIVKNN